MVHIINELHKILTLIRDLIPAHGTPSKGVMLLEREGDGVYMLQITKVGEKDTHVADFKYLL